MEMIYIYDFYDMKHKEVKNNYTSLFVCWK